MVDMVDLQEPSHCPAKSLEDVSQVKNKTVPSANLAGNVSIHCPLSNCPTLPAAGQSLHRSNQATTLLIWEEMEVTMVVEDRWITPM